ncbi:MBL fold metallo-hydrolase [Myceligenerans crystallogenes]|uniref:MBL fold metallo-hydrolase n=1 Tax=Myceligenerans crystallogenes TaxID=316335 RepID=UPI003CD0B5F2
MRTVTPFVSVQRAENPGPMTLDGTRSYVLRAPGSESSVVVDPGPDLGPHLDALAAAGPVELVLITHRHADHTAGSAGLRHRTGAPVRAMDPAHCLGAEPLRGGELIRAAGLRIEVLATPGHTGDSVSFAVTGPTNGLTPFPETVVLTGDTVLGKGTTVIAEPDGSLGAYLESLDLLESVAGESTTGLPAHGDPLPDLAAAVRLYRAHRIDRLEQIRKALKHLGTDDAIPDGDLSTLTDDVVRAVYDDVDPSVLPAARQSVLAQLRYLRGGL